jgi:DNA processing protein
MKLIPPAAANEQEAVLTLVAATTGPWHATASLIESAGSALRILEGRWGGFDLFDQQAAESLVGRVRSEHREQADRALREASGLGVTVLTILDEQYPVNLREVFNRPPFLFVRGRLKPTDDHAIAVVGTREASTEGVKVAGLLCRAFAEAGVTVVSGLARGIDTAAHRATVAAAGRTLAVIGTGIARVYPPENADLADEIVGQGAIVSQFWPSAAPTRASFPMRNAVMSGMAVGTVVVEASSTSGARMQARLALEHGKRLFLLESLVAEQGWARRYAEHRAAVVVRSADDVLDVVLESTTPPRQLSFG